MPDNDHACWLEQEGTSRSASARSADRVCQHGALGLPNLFNYRGYGFSACGLNASGLSQVRHYAKEGRFEVGHYTLSTRLVAPLADCGMDEVG